MSLLDQYTAECVLLTKTRTDDPYGGYKTTWTPGIHFFPAWEFMGAAEVVVAEQQGTSRVYRIYTDKTLNLDYHEVFKRLKDGQVFRVTNPGTDRNTPASSRLNRRLVEVEKWEIPHDEVITDASDSQST